MARMNEIGHGFAFDPHVFFVKTDALVLLQYWCTRLPYDSIALTNGSWDMPDFIAPRFPFTEFSPQRRKRFRKRVPD